MRKILSYLFPISIKKYVTPFNTIEIQLHNGKYILDSKTVNYSYGNLELILEKALRFIGFSTIKTYNNTLVLGVAGGSVIATLYDKIKYKGKIVAVDLDKEMLHLASDFFLLNKHKNCTFINLDAYDFCKQTKEEFNLVIVDLFLDDLMPSFIFTEEFNNELKRIVAPNGTILINTMFNDKVKAKKQVTKIESFYPKNKYKTTVLEKVLGTNDVLVIKTLP